MADLRVRIFYTGASEPLYFTPRQMNLAEELVASGFSRLLSEYFEAGLDFWIVALHSDLQDEPYPLVVETTVHEPAHVGLDQSGATSLDDESNANAQAIRWGFGPEIMALVRGEAARKEGDSAPAWEECVTHIDELEALAQEQHKDSR